MSTDPLNASVGFVDKILKTASQEQRRGILAPDAQELSSFKDIGASVKL